LSNTTKSAQLARSNKPAIGNIMKKCLHLKKTRNRRKSPPPTPSAHPTPNRHAQPRATMSFGQAATMGAAAQAGALDLLLGEGGLFDRPAAHRPLWR
jgi:hypothetical protein